MRAWLLVLASCTGAVAPKPDDPNVVYDQLRNHYATARTCLDSGTITLVAKDGDKLIEPYELQFVRDAQWRLTFGRGTDAIVIWADAQHTYVKVPESARLDLGPDHARAIVALKKVSKGGATAVLELLLSRAEAPAHLAWAKPPDPQVAHLRGDHAGRPIELTIARDRGELRAMSMWAGDVEIRVESKAVLDGAVAVAAPPVDEGPPSWLGIRTEDAPARVSQVVPGAPADKAGVKIGDEVVSIDGKPIADAKGVVEGASQLKANKPAPVVVRRKGVEVPLTVTPEARPDAASVQATFVGKPAPALSLPSLAGGAPITLAAGQVTVLDFWATWCGPCAILSPHLEDLTHKFPALRVIGISDEDAADIAGYLAKHKVTYTLARDPDDRATKDYLVQGLPTVVVIDKAGIVRYATVGVPDFSQLDAAIAQASR